MGRDLRQSRIEYYHRDKIYDSVYIDNYQVKPNSICKSVIYTKEVSSIYYSRKINSSMAYDTKSITIETIDKAKARPNDFILHCGEVYRVLEVTEEKDNTSVYYSRRPIMKTTLVISRKV